MSDIATQYAASRSAPAGTAPTLSPARQRWAAELAYCRAERRDFLAMAWSYWRRGNAESARAMLKVARSMDLRVTALLRNFKWRDAA